ncbi:MAG TPA: CNNM domain-containing protein [Phycisphaerae bacterium]|nr:CNNM domain-containing protein [Phycisphaerae bacterium]HRW52726.1 CNNM domain-containing protein [Phycisphaerae bacterium]
MLLLFLYAILALGVSFLCSLLEAALLSIPRSHVALLAESGSRTGARLSDMKANIDKPLAAILTLNTIAHTVGAAGVGAEAAIIFGDWSIGVVSAVMTLLILVLSEIIPKTLGAAHAKRLAGFTATTTRGMMILTLPVVIALEWIHHLIGFRRADAPVSRAELLATMRLGHEAGALDAREFQIVRNLIALKKVRLRDVHTPRSVIYALPADRTIADLSEERGVFQFARIPIYEGAIDHPIGYVTRSDIHRCQQNGGADMRLASLVKPIRLLNEEVSVADALESMLAHREHIAIVRDAHGGTTGLITLEDVIETMIGEEIVDETDPVVDLQALAGRLEREMRNRRRDSADEDRPD